MAIYFGRDLEVGDEGDLVINDRGDLSIAESTDSTRHLLKMIVATDIGELPNTPSFGANLGDLIGRDLAEVLERVPVLIRDGIRRGGYINPGDVFVDVYPIDYDKLMAFVDLRGTYIDSEGAEVANPSGTLKFFFPYTEERIREWT